MGIIYFSARISIKGINPFVIVSRENIGILELHTGKPLPVVVKVNGAPAAGVKTNLMPRGDGSFFLYLNAIMRKAGHAEVGDVAKLEVAPDQTYRPGPCHPMPGLFTAALKSNPAAAVGWKKLTASRKKEILRYFANLKATATLERNVAKAIAVLAGARARFMAREWNDDDG